jgi:hypothetical protein
MFVSWKTCERFTNVTTNKIRKQASPSIIISFIFAKDDVKNLCFLSYISIGLLIVILLPVKPGKFVGSNFASLGIFRLSNFPSSGAALLSRVRRSSVRVRHSSVGCGVAQYGAA